MQAKYRRQRIRPASGIHRPPYWRSPPSCRAPVVLAEILAGRRSSHGRSGMAWVVAVVYGGSRRCCCATAGPTMIWYLARTCTVVRICKRRAAVAGYYGMARGSWL
jgi:hypothetical protein